MARPGVRAARIRSCLAQQIRSHSDEHTAEHAGSVVNDLDPQYQRQAPNSGGVGRVAAGVVGAAFVAAAAGAVPVPSTANVHAHVSDRAASIHLVMGYLLDRT
jgi:hypothetical protein